MDEDETEKKITSQKNGGKKTTKTATKRKAEVSIYLALFRILFFLVVHKGASLINLSIISQPLCIKFDAHKIYLKILSYASAR